LTSVCQLFSGRVSPPPVAALSPYPTLFRSPPESSCDLAAFLARLSISCLISAMRAAEVPSRWTVAWKDGHSHLSSRNAPRAKDATSTDSSIFLRCTSLRWPAPSSSDICPAFLYPVSSRVIREGVCGRHG